jgi:hypothetical protein
MERELGQLGEWILWFVLLFTFVGFSSVLIQGWMHIADKYRPKPGRIRGGWRR